MKLKIIFMMTGSDLSNDHLLTHGIDKSFGSSLQRETAYLCIKYFTK